MFIIIGVDTIDRTTIVLFVVCHAATSGVADYEYTGKDRNE